MKYLLPLLLFLVLSSHAQTITTIAGTGVSGYSGDGGAATAATMHNPLGIGLKSDGSVVIAEGFNNAIRWVDRAGIIHTICGNGTAGYAGDGGPATAALINGPYGLYIDNADQVFIADDGNNLVRKIDFFGTINTVGGLTATGGYFTDGHPATATYINSPIAVTEDDSANLYVIELGYYVMKIDTFGILHGFAGNGIMGGTGDGGPATAAELSFARGIAADPAGNIYITDFGTHRIRKVDPAGIITTIAGTGVSGYSGDGGAATAAEFGDLAGVVINTAGELLIADGSNNCIRKIDTRGVITTIVGVGGLHSYGYSGDGGPATAALLHSPWGVALDCANNLYFTDELNNVVRRVQLNHAPAFAGGAVQTTMACAGVSKDITTLLAVNDPDSMNTETWSLLAAPAHGTATAGYVTNSTGSTVTPTGLTYMATAGYYGMDTFRVAITDCEFTDSVTIAVRVDTGVHAGMITGADTLCTSHTPDTLADSMAGGIWHISNSHATVSATGAATGISAGTDTVQYVVTNGCGSDTANHAVTVVVCPSLTPALTEGEGVMVYPNPIDDQLNIDDIPNNGTYTIKSIVGTTLLHGTLYSGSNKVSTAALTPGMYVLCVMDEKGVKINYKLIKQ
jgi:trimeric autotransporter adhesin